jgi:hypothetical protein
VPISANEAQRAGVAINHRRTVEEERGRKCAQQKVFECGFLRQQPTPPCQPAHQVQRQRQHLERDEHCQQVVGGREQQHAADGEHRQRKHLGLHYSGLGSQLFGHAARDRRRLRGERVQSAAAGLRIRWSTPLGDEQDTEHADEQNRALQEQRRRVDGDSAQHRGVSGLPVQISGEHDHRHERRDQPAEAEDELSGVPLPAGQEGLDENTDDSHPQDDQHGGEQAVFDAGSGQPKSFGHGLCPSASLGAGSG